MVATVLTVYGIETPEETHELIERAIKMLQQYLPFTVLKPLPHALITSRFNGWLQQYLPFTVLKPKSTRYHISDVWQVATVLTVYGIETFKYYTFLPTKLARCNSTYRLRY